jgi:tetratricopeptide (TPR) repeat protein
MLSAVYADIKRLRCSGNYNAAVALLKTNRPTGDDDAFEALVCLFASGDLPSSLNVARTYGWKTRWAGQMARALATLLDSGDTAAALKLARAAIGEAGAGHDATAIYLILLQANGLNEEADQFIQRRFRTLPAGETLLLTVMAEIAAAVRDWKRAYQLASAVNSLDTGEFHAQMTLSLANFEVGYVHEALGNALRANKIRAATQPAVLQIMRCYNKLGDYYAAIGAFFELQAADTPQTIAPELHVEMGIAWQGIGKTDEAIAAFNAALSTAQAPGSTAHATAIRTMLNMHIQCGASSALETLVRDYAPRIDADIECLNSLGLARLAQRDLTAAAQAFDASYALFRQENRALDLLPWPAPEPRLRHDFEQLEMLSLRGKLDAAGQRALAVLQRTLQHPEAQTPDTNSAFAPPGAEGEALQQVLCGFWHRPELPFAGQALGANDYGNIERQYFDSRPALAVIDNFLSPQALASLRHYSEEATVWKLHNDRGYAGALLGQGFCSPVLLAIADQLKQALPRVIGDYPLLQAWGFKYDQRMQGINLHADFAKINVNFWITPDSACADHTTGGMVVYDVPAPASWTFADYNTNQSKMTAYLKAHNAQSQRVPYRENRCVLFDSSLMHVTDELHFKPGYENRRVNVTLLYGRARSQG